jgi:riboflavin kinase/FMN adenylyltransferase
MNIGKKPTVNSSNEKSLEVHIFDFNKDIYGDLITVFMEKHIRNEKKFANLDELKRAISNDEITCRRYYNLPLVSS